MKPTPNLVLLALPWALLAACAGGGGDGDSRNRPPEVRPGQVVASASGATRVDLTWVDRALDETAFEIQRAIPGGSFLAVGSVLPDTTTFTDVDLLPEQSVQYRVRALFADGTSATSDAVAATTLPRGLAITFPPPLSMTDQNTITVRGTLAQADGVTAVTVAGIAATTVDDFRTWQAVVPLQAGESELRVESIGRGGQPEAGGESRRVRRETAMPFRPTRVVLDIFGTTAYVLEPVVGDVDIIAIDLTSGERRVVSGANAGSGAAIASARDIAIASPGNAIFVLARDSASQLIRVDVSSGQRVALALLPPGNPSCLTIATDGNGVERGYVLNGRDLLRVDLSSGSAVTIATNILPAGLGFGEPSLAVRPGAGRFAITKDLDLFTFDPATAVTRRFAGLGRGPAAFDPVTGRVIVADDAGVVAIDPNGFENTVTSFAPEQFVGRIVDCAGPIPGAREVLLLDGARQRLYSVGLDSGTVARADDYDLGTGAPLADHGSTAMIVDGSGSVAVADALADTVRRVESSSGDRVELSPPNESQLLRVVRRLAFDQQNSRLLARTATSVVAIALENGERTLISPEPIASGLDVAALADRANGRILGINSSRVVEIDPDTGGRTVVSGPGRGSGPPFADAADIAVDLGGNRAVVLDGVDVANTGPAVISVDLTTGDRVLLSGRGAGSGPALDGVGRRLAVTPDGSKAFVVQRGASIGQATILAIDLATGDRTVSSSDTVGAGPPLYHHNTVPPRDIAIDDLGRLYVLDLGRAAVVCIDEVTRQRVIVTK